MKDVFASRIETTKSLVKACEKLKLKAFINASAVGVVLAKDSNFIKSLYPSHRLGLGGALGTGRQWISWIHLDDVVRIVQFLLEPNCSVPVGPVNATSPNAVRQAALSRCLSEAIGAPRLPFGAPPAPAFVFRALLGSDRATLVLDGQRVIPKKLLDARFQFRYTRLEDALQAIFGRKPSPPAYD
ncbi:unnamed protein product [Echinostoma caproni]|uniref:DUF1731 domain-containing protein n=1 Tax=Echinostoma caproni TaxID=27848 RepID=A0A183ADQ3_9TREM|nr:unnamed protein product [Echinostoma caproni]